MKLPLPAGTFRAYLFDCDGTIVDSMPLHYIAWKTALAEWSCTFDEGLFYSWGGKPVDEIISTLNAMQGLSMPVAVVSKRKEGLYYQLLPQLKAIPEGDGTLLDNTLYLYGSGMSNGDKHDHGNHWNKDRSQRS